MTRLAHRFRAVASSQGVTIEALPPDREQFEELAGWIAVTAVSPFAILDVGGGGSFYDFPSRLRDSASRIVGVDPDPKVLERPWFDEAHAVTVEKYARHVIERKRDDSHGFDLALCVYVVEHVEDPTAFLSAIRSLLNPGGSCFGVTPNLWHYFGLCSRVASLIGIEDWLLHKVRPSELIEAYHSPVRYHMNSVRSLAAESLAAGFRSVEFRTLEHPGMFETYFPPQLQWFPRAYSLLINRLGFPSLYGTLLFRLGC